MREKTVAGRGSAGTRPDPGLERDIVVELRFWLRCGSAAAAAPARALIAAAPAEVARSAGPGAAAQHLHVADTNLGRVPVVAVAVLPLPRLQLALDVDLGSLLQVFAGDLGQPVEEHEPVPLGSFHVFTGLLVLPCVRRREAAVGDGAATRHVLGFGVRTEISDQDHFVYTARHQGTPVSRCSERFFNAPRHPVREGCILYAGGRQKTRANPT